MFKGSKFTKAILGVTLAACIGAQPVVAMAAGEATNADKINSGIANLNYDRNVVLANNGDTVESVTPKEGLFDGDKFMVIEREKKSLGTTPVDISVVDSVVNRTYPGSILLANEDYANNRPTMVMAKRAPLDITIDLPGLNDGNTVTVDDPSYGSVTAAIDTLIDKWSEESSGDHTLPARTQYSETMVYSKMQLAMGLNIDINAAEPLFGINFEAIHKGEEKYMVASYKQIFYTVTAKLPNNPSDLFDPSVTFAELARKGVSETSPPVMVNNVAYGRTIYVVLSTKSQSDQVEAAFKALIKGQKIESHSEFEQVIENSSFTVVVMGGDAQEHNKLITTDFDEIRSIIKDNATFSTKNPGYPISYSSTFLKDNSLAAVHNNTDYVEVKSTMYSQGKLTLDHSGAYVARFHVTWDEVTYDDEGNEIVEHKAWDRNDQDLTAHFSTTINLPANAKNINVKAIECTGLAWEWWRTVVDEVKLPLTNDMRVSIGGTTLHPSHSVELT